MCNLYSMAGVLGLHIGLLTRIFHNSDNSDILGHLGDNVIGDTKGVPDENSLHGLKLCNVSKRRSGRERIFK
jgi:hypothetical protein